MVGCCITWSLLHSFWLNLLMTYFFQIDMFKISVSIFGYLILLRNKLDIYFLRQNT